MKTRSLIIASLLSVALFTCKKKADEQGNLPASEEVKTSCNDVNLFSINQDAVLGAQVDSQIRATPNEYPIMDSASNSEAYKILYKIRDEIFTKANVDHENDFKWKIAIIKGDSTLNAFCTPGGYMYIYTGIIKYLDNEDDFAGVLGHEIGHAALRHSTDNIIRTQGIGVLIGIVTGKNPSKLAEITAGLAGKLSLLKYNRCHETQSDEFSVSVLRNTKYKCNGAASFFEKIVAAGGSSGPTFLSTHPEPGNRVESINATATRLACNKTVPAANTDWARLQQLVK